MVVEILSEGNNKADADEKFNIYQDAGILEYWIALPDTPLPDTLTH